MLNSRRNIEFNHLQQGGFFIPKSYESIKYTFQVRYAI